MEYKQTLHFNWQHFHYKAVLKTRKYLRTSMKYLHFCRFVIFRFFLAADRNNLDLGLFSFLQMCVVQYNKKRLLNYLKIPRNYHCIFRMFIICLFVTLFYNLNTQLVDPLSVLFYPLSLQS